MNFRSPSPIRVIGGEALNICILAVPIVFLSSWLMDLAAWILNAPVAWPQISFMSAYPKGVRNGYLLFVLSILVTVFLSSGVFAVFAGASPGKAMVGIRYVSASGDKALPSQMFLRAALFVVLLLPVLLLGPILGFVFGPVADIFSVFSLAAGGFVFWYFAGFSEGDRTWVNRTAKLYPSMRRSEYPAK